MGRRHKSHRKAKTPHKNIPKSGNVAKKSVPHMHAKLINLKKWLLHLFSSKGFHGSVIFIIGISLILIGAIFAFKNSIRDWNKIGPGILIASDKPLCGVRVLVFTESDGTTTLLVQEADADEILSVSSVQHSGQVRREIQAEEEKEKNLSEQNETVTVSQEEYHLWIYLNSCEDVPINWTISPQLGDVKNYELSQAIPGNYSDFIASETNKNSGSDKMTAFKITFGGTHIGSVEIKLSEDPEHAVFRGNGISMPRVPFVSVWHGFEYSSEPEDLLNDFLERNRNISDADLMRLSVNGCQMYFPILKIETSYASLTKQHDLEPMWISPAPENEYPLFRWTQYVSSFPTIQFRDKTWENNAKRNNLLGGIFVGIGINVIFTLFSDLCSRKKKR